MHLEAVLSIGESRLFIRKAVSYLKFQNIRYILKCMVNIKIYEVKERTELLMEQFLKVWEESVRATHQFLSEKEIEKIRRVCPTGISRCIEPGYCGQWFR